MKLPLRYFLAFSILLGAIGLPWAWRTYQSRRAAEIERLEKELGELWKSDPFDEVFVEILSGGTPHNPSFAAEQEEWEKRIAAIKDRLEVLTGNRPERPEESYPEIRLGRQNSSTRR